MLPARKIDEFDDFNEYHNYILKSHVDLKKEQYKKQQEKATWVKKLNGVTKALTCAVLVFASLSLVVMSYANICERKYMNYGLQKDIVEYKLEIEDLKAQLESVVVLENIEKVAIEELNMQYPKQEQIVYVDSSWNYQLTKDHSVVATTDEVITEAPNDFDKAMKNLALLVGNFIGESNN